MPDPSQPDNTTPFLTVTDADGPRDAPLSDVTRLGRGDDNDVQVLHAQVSKRHAEIHRSEGTFSVVDVGSKAGVYVNGNAVQRRKLADGDEIRLGAGCPVRIVFRDPAAGPRSRSSLLSTFSDGRGREGMRTLSRFLEFSRVLASLAPSQVLANVVDMAIETTGAERGFVILVAGDDALRFEAMRGRGGEDLPPGSPRISETIVRQVLADKHPRIVHDVGEDDDLALAQSVMSLQLGSAVAMPLWRHRLPDDDAPVAQATDEVFGVLYLDSKTRRNAFNRIDVGILESLAFDASSAMENARLLREVEDKRRMDQELARACEVQASLLPDSFWGTAYAEIAGSCTPCLDLGGDFAGQVRMGGDRMGFVVADVCGKGISAALLAAALKGAVTIELDADRPLGEIVSRVNAVIADLAPVGMFVSALFGILSSDGELQFVNAGHCPLLVTDANGVQELVTGGLALGIDESFRYDEHRVRVEPNEFGVLYTDGVLETENPERERFGAERLSSIVAEGRGASAPELALRIIAAVESFRDGAPVADDLTLLVVRYVGA